MSSNMSSAYLPASSANGVAARMVVSRYFVTSYTLAPPDALVADDQIAIIFSVVRRHLGQCESFLLIFQCFVVSMRLQRVRRLSLHRTQRLAALARLI